ncbi:hypothetical protein Misp06_03428 [Microbulbifer sp. NBRC 101763]|uniref:SMI1/KNR4 family protein n=1 Tax=unclassified Microbulbifer TaxID=2619833 RepID=UPI003099C63F
MNVTLPQEYIEFLKSSDQLWGETDYELGEYFELEPLDTIEKMNKDIGIVQAAPGFIAFACDGGGEVFVFDESGQIFILPLIGMEPGAAVKLASSWSEFETHIAQSA